MISRLLLFVLLPYVTVKGFEWVKLNTVPVCFGSSNDDYGQFTVGRDIEARNIKFSYVSGHHDCSDVAGGYFGCELYMWAYFSQADEGITNTTQNDIASDDKNIKGKVKEYLDEIMKPEKRSRQKRNIATPDYSPGPQALHRIYAILTDSNNNPIVPTLTNPGDPYYYIPQVYRPAFDYDIIVPSYGMPYVFQNGQVVRLWHGEDLQNVDDANNQGQLCADVYAEIESVTFDPACRCLTEECLAQELSDTNCHSAPIFPQSGGQFDTSCL